MSFNEDKKFWTEFIELYRSLRSLWDVRCKDYINKHIKKENYACLVQKLREKIDNADEEMVKKKVECLRASFRRELKKVEKSKKTTGNGSDSVYEPTLWYYNMMMFTIDNPPIREGKSSLTRPIIAETIVSDDVEFSTIDDEDLLQVCNLCSFPYL